MAKRRRNRRPTEGSSHTLPLFDEPSRFDLMAGREKTRESCPGDLVLEVYSSAILHAHALASAAMRGASSRECWALRRLVRKEEERKELAAQLLDEIWGVRLAA